MADEIVVGSVGVEVVPDARGFGPRTASQIDPEMKALGKQVGRELGRDIAAPIAPAIRDSVRDGIKGTRGQGAKGGTEFGGAFADSAKTRIAAAFRDLPKAKVGTDATELDAELVSIRARLEALHDVRIGVDLDAGEALAEIEAVKIRLTELAAKSPHIDVKVDATRAAAELAAIAAEAKAVSATDVNIGGGSGGGGFLSSLVGGAGQLASGFSAAGVAAAVLATALIPIAAGLAAIIASALLLGSILAGAFVAAALGLAPIIKAMLALSAADKSNASSAASNAAAQVNAAEAVKSARASLANTTANADSAAVRSAEAVLQARQRLVDVTRQASRSILSAVQGEQSAEHSLTVALREQGDAQKALTQARSDAQRQIEDLQRAVTDGALDQKQAELDIKAARQRLQDVNSNPLSSALERQQAKLDYDQAVQRLDDLTAANKRLGQDAADAAAKGVSGADSVLAAQQRLIDAVDATAAARRNLANAEQAVDDARLQAAEQIRDAEQGISDALRSQADQARQSAFAISQAQAAVGAAQRGQQQATDQISASAKKADDALAGLTPTGRAFVTFLRDEFIPQVKKVIEAATDGIAPGLMQGLVILEGIMPSIAEDMGKFAGAVGGFFTKIAQGLASPGAKRFFDFLADLSGPALSGVADFLINIGSGLAGIFEALAPVAADIGRTILDLAQKFADFGNSAGTGGSLDKFVTFLETKGPGIAQNLADIATAVAQIVVDLAPFGVLVLDVVGGLGKLYDIVRPILKVLPGTAQQVGDLGKSFKDTKKTISDLLGKAGDLIGFFRGAWTSVISKLARPFSDAVDTIQTAFGDIKHAAVGARDYIEGRFDVLVGFIEGLPARVSKAAVGMFDGIKDAFRSAINFVINAWNDLSFGIDVPSKVFGVPVPGGGGHVGIDTPNITPLALGGLVTGPTLAMVGEGSESEFVTPLSALGDFGQWAKELGWSQAMTSAPAAAGSHGGPRTVIEHIDIHNPVPETASESPSKLMRRLEHTLS